MLIPGKSSEDKWSVSWKPVLIFTLFTVGILVLIYIYYNSQKSRIFAEQKDNLSAVSVLKLSQIELWRQERIGNATVIKDNLPLVDIIHQYIESNNPVLRPELQKWMGSIRYQYDYSDILVVDTSLKIRMSFSHSGLSGKYEYGKEVRDLSENMSIQLTDIKRNSGDSLYMDILIPLVRRIKERPQLFGILILRIDPALKLFPLIRLWPTSSTSSETLLIRKDGDSILYLNDLRHKANTALNLRLSRNIELLLASMAVRGKLGLAEGVDYRGVPVVGYISAVPQLPWYMVTKTDKAELLSPVKKTNFDSILISLLVLIINSFLFLNWNRNQQQRANRAKLATDHVKNELNESEHQLHKSEKLFRNLFENMLNGFAYCKMLHEEALPLDFLYIKVNKAFTKLTGLNDVEGKCASEVIPGIQTTDQNLLQRYLRVSVSGEAETFEIYVESMKMWFLISVYCPEKEYFVAVFDVITERKNAETSLLESEDKFKYVFDNSMIGKSITLPNGEIQVNKAFCNMTGYSQEELSGLNWKDISHPDEIELNQNAVNSLLSGKVDSIRFNKRYIRKDGSILWVDISSALRRDKNGKPLYFLTSLNDISEQRHAEEILRDYNKNLEQSVIQRTEQLEAANKELEAFSYSVSHDLRAPLRAVHGFTKILKEDYGKFLDDEGRRICGIISSSANQMSELIDDLLSFSRIGRSTVSYAVLNMEVMANSIAMELSYQKNGKEYKFSIDKLDEVKGDPGLIKLVWNNLISNAIKYSSKEFSPEISITSQKWGDYITYSVSDNGVGFEMRYANKLFGVFQRLHSENEFEGNGVGLAIVKRIINKHGGKIWAESEAGNGATFSFTLPAVENLSISE